MVLLLPDAPPALRQPAGHQQGRQVLAAGVLGSPVPGCGGAYGHFCPAEACHVVAVPAAPQLPVSLLQF